ncbi:MAG TPA: DUF559 domain-containing protein, partial [Ferruginibacter sp.]|nr:DUF559 domain-containing protein [Ferruginibacter sp.]
GAEVEFGVRGYEFGVKVYTTRPDTIFGVDFMVLAPEHELVASITTEGQKEEIEKYLAYVKSRSERERLAEAKTITGCFTGAYAINPFDGREIPIWTAEYVLAGYGTGAIMAVPCGDQRDFAFAKHFNIPITNIIGSHYNGGEANPTKEAVLENSGFLNGMLMKDAIGVAVNKVEELGIGKRKVNYRMRDAGFSRQRYWGEPFPIVWEDGVAVPLDEKELPLELPHVDKYGPGPSGEGPLANLTDWVNLTPASPKERVANLTPNPSPKERGTKDPAAYGYINSTTEEWKNTLQFARQNRKDATVEEDIIWQELRNRNIAGFKFRRQHPIAGYIPDFVCLEKKLIIEIDGGYHNEAGQAAFDKAREQWLAEQGFTMVRFTNEAVNNSLNTVLKDIEQALLSKETVSGTGSSHTPLPWRGAGGEVKRETSTMPGYAGSSWYFLRYMDPHNNQTFCDRKASDYWNQVDLYIGGTEHAVGHLLYSRMWTKVLYDLGMIGFDEPYKKLLNQGMITGVSELLMRPATDVESKDLQENEEDITVRSNYIEVINNGKIEKIQVSDIVDTVETFYSVEVAEQINEIKRKEKKNPDFRTFNEIRFPISCVDNHKLNYHKLIEQAPHYSDAVFVTQSGYFKKGMFTKFESIADETSKEIVTKSLGEKMSKSKLNTENPDDLVLKYGADTFRMYEMFLGPVEASKPWDTKGIEGVHRFLRKLWRLFNDEMKGKLWNEEKATDAELKILHRTIKKIEEDTERFSFNTAVSTFMICVNELADVKCHKKEVLEKLLVLLTPYAPHIAEELWHQLGNEGSVLDASYPVFNPALLVESSKEYPVSVNGKLRTNITLALDLDQKQVEEAVLQNEIVQKWLDGKPPKKIIFVKNKMINVVI